MKHQRLFLLSASLVAVLAILLLVTATSGTGPAHAAAAACWKGPHEGTITSDQTWCATDNPHILSNGVIVAPGVILTLEPGVMVMAAEPDWSYLAVQGHLEAVGTEQDPIIFTSQADNGPDQWKGITFDEGTGRLRHVTVRNAGRACYGCQGYQTGAIAAFGVQAGVVTIEDSQVVSTASGPNSDHGLYVVNSRVVVSDTLFQGIGDNPVQDDFPVFIVGATSEVSLSGNRFVGNVYDRVLLAPGAMTAHDFTLAAQPVLEGYQLGGDTTGSGFIVPAGITMTVEPGVKVMAGTNGSSYLAIKGHLEAVGTEAQPVIFTSQWDSGPDQWPGITFDGGTGHLRHAVVRYAGRGCYGCQGYQTGAIAAFGIQSGQVTIEDSQVLSIASAANSDHGLYVINSRVVVSNTLFSAIGNDLTQAESAIYASGNSSLHLGSSAVEKNVGSGLVVDGATQVQITDSSIVQNSRHGVEIYGGSAVLTMRGSKVLANVQDGVRNNGSAQVTLGGAKGLGNTILGNGGPGADQVGTGTQMNATYNWWGHVTGPYHAALNPGGKGEDVSDRVLFDPWAADWQGNVPAGVFVSLTGPRTVAPGGTASYKIAYINGRSETVENAVLVVVLPLMTSFLDATHGGEYLAQEHAVVWKLGNLEAGASGTAAAQVQYAWGLPDDDAYAAQARLGGTNLPLGLTDVQWYLDSSSLDLLASPPLTGADLLAERLAYPDLDLIYREAEAAGFLSGGAVRLALSTGEPITQVVLMRPDRAEVMYLRRQGEQVLASTFGLAGYAVRRAAGGLAVDLQSDTETFWGTWGSGTTPSAEGKAYSDCRYPNVPALVLEDKLTHLSQVLSSATCYPCLSGGGCGGCFAALQQVVPLPEASSAMACAGEAGKAGGPEPEWLIAPPDLPDCPTGSYYVMCTKGWLDKVWSETWYPCLGGSVVWNEGYGLSKLGPAECGRYETCHQGVYTKGVPSKVGCQCEPVYTPPKVSARSWLSGCNSEEEEGVSTCSRTRIWRPKDPNAKYGLEGDLLPGQLATYTVTYENEGAGRAYGVYVVDPLDESFDLATLTIHGPGQLIAENRTILWTVGELGPAGDPDSHGVVSYTVELLDSLPAGTAIVNEAIVYFPTVPEVTPTNPVVNIVEPLAAVPQQVATTYRQPVDITLAGRGPSGVPLGFVVVRQPLNGALSGTAPHLVYTPAENATGLDSFTFTVSGEGRESRPAKVQIVIDPSGDTVPPRVRWTYPGDGAMEVAVSPTPVLTDGVGPVYAPLPFVQFSEAMDGETVTDDVVRMVNSTGQEVPVSVFYDGVVHRAVIYPREPLQTEMLYTVTVRASVKDLAGNAMGADHAWSFQTQEELTTYYLPVVRCNHH